MKDNSMENQEKPYTVKDISKFLQLNRIKVYRLIEEGELKAVNISLGNKRPNWRITVEAFNEFMSSRQNS